MQYKDTLTLYEELIAEGTPEAQAKVIAHQHGAVGSSIDNLRLDMNSFKADMKADMNIFKSSIEKMLNRMDNKIDLMGKDIFWMKLIGTVMAITFSAHFIAPLFKN